MAVTIKVNGTSNSLAHKGDGGFSQSTLPDVCKTPSPAGPVPVPYPVIISTSGDLVKGSKTVKADGGNMIAIKGSELSRCSGDEAGTAGGVKSSTNMKEASWLLYSFDVKIEGKNACRLSDKLLMNSGNTACLGGYFVKPTTLSAADSQLWDDCVAQHDKYKATQAEQASIPDSPEFIDEKIKVVVRLHKERTEYVDMGCDKFDWNGNGSTPAQREARHRAELKRVNKHISNLYIKRKGFYS